MTIFSKKSIMPDFWAKLNFPQKSGSVNKPILRKALN